MFAIMLLVIDSLFWYVLVTFLAVSLGTVAYYWWSFQYWIKRGLPNLETPKIPFGSLPYLFPPDVYMGIHIKNLYSKSKLQGFKHGGIFVCSTPMYVVIDLEYTKNVLQGDFNFFTERGFYYNEKHDAISANLFAIGGERWRFLRTKLSPAFTSVKLKMMFEGFLQCAYQMQENIEQFCENKQVVNIKDTSESFTIDTIGSYAFGLDCNCFKYPENEFKKQGRKIFHFNFLRLAKVGFAFYFPNIGRRLGIAVFDKESNNFFINLVKKTLEYREANNVTRKDFLQLLFKLQKEPEVENRNELQKGFLTLEQLTAQLFILFGAGFESSSITMAFSFYEVAKNQEIQDKLREEIKQVLINYEGKLSYDAIMDMKYLNQVVKETLRKYPAVSFITRKCVKDYQIPGTKIVIEKGMDVMVSILGIHHDPEYYPDPEIFNPERFSDENKKHILPFTYMPFGEGPRICIGLRFALMQLKVGLVMLLTKYKFSLNKRTRVPLQINPLSFTMSPREGIFLDIERANT